MEKKEGCPLCRAERISHWYLESELFPATSQKDVRFHQLHDKDGARIQQKRVCSKDGEEIPLEHIVKGYEVSRDRYVVVTPEELEALDPKASRTIDIHDFVDLEEI